ncbi:MAG: DUF3110 domain-containing protein [Thermostichales cyanobacterium SRBZ-1_bins_19]
MTEAEALHLLQLDAGASPKQVRSRRFQEYQRLTAALSQLDDERQRPLLEAQLKRLIQARDLLLGGESQALLNPADFPPQIAVLLCRQGSQEGIYTQRLGSQDIVVCFDQEFAARKYAQQLGKKGLPKPSLEWFDSREILEFCRDNGYGLTLIPSDAAVAPPDAVADTLEAWRPPHS